MSKPCQYLQRQSTHRLDDLVHALGAQSGLHQVSNGNGPNKRLQSCGVTLRISAGSTVHVRWGIAAAQRCQLPHCFTRTLFTSACSLRMDCKRESANVTQIAWILVQGQTSSSHNSLQTPWCTVECGVCRNAGAECQRQQQQVHSFTVGRCTLEKTIFTGIFCIHW